jgi:hypothetical protein
MLQPGRWEDLLPPKQQNPPTRLHGTITQKTTTLQKFALYRININLYEERFRYYDTLKHDLSNYCTYTITGVPLIVYWFENPCSKAFNKKI